MRKRTLFAKRSKCVFGVPQVEYLGHVISAEGVATDPSKIQAMKDWPVPKTIKQLRGFLGLTFIKNYALISQPLTTLLKKNLFGWNAQAEGAFQMLQLRGYITTRGHLIAYLSKSLAPRHWSLSTYEKELMAVVLALDKITTLFQTKWLPKLLGFDYEINYNKGSDNAAANALSRLPTSKNGRSNITMEEYIRLEEEKAQRHGRTFNWQTATFGKVKSYEDEDDCFIDFETEFPAIVFDNTLTSDITLLCAPTPSSPELTVDCLDDLDYFKHFENEFPAIVYNDGLTSKSDLEVKPPVSSGHINKFETSLSKYDEEGRNALHVIFPDNLKRNKDSDDNIYIT
ncbi:hypothetical protein Tco_0387369 [Tanacetum coccineum]